MRKLYWIVVLALLTVVANFALWFWHTRVIINAVENARYELRTIGIKMEYNEIKFTNFKAWDLDGKIHGLTLHNVHGIGVLKLDEVALQSIPYQRVIRLTSTPKWLLAKDEATPEEEAVKLQFSTSPGLDVKFKKSVRDFNNEVTYAIKGDSKVGGPMRSIRDLTLNLGGMEAKMADKMVLKWNNATLEAVIKIEPDKVMEVMETRCSECRSSLSYFFGDLPPELHSKMEALSEQIGDISYSFETKKVKTFSENTKAALKDRLGEDVDLDEVGASFDSEYHEANLTLITKQTTAKVDSIYPVRGTQGMQSKMVITVEGYKALVHNLIQSMNLSLETLQYMPAPFLRLDPSKLAQIQISPAQADAVITAFKQFEQSDNEIMIQWNPYYKSSDTDRVMAFASNIISILMPNFNALVSEAAPMLSGNLTPLGQPQLPLPGNPAVPVVPGQPHPQLPQPQAQPQPQVSAKPGS